MVCLYYIKYHAIMAKNVENFFSVENAPRAQSPPTFIWSFFVPSSPGLDVPNSPTVPTHTFILITSKLKEIDKFNI